MYSRSVAYNSRYSRQVYEILLNYLMLNDSSNCWKFEKFTSSNRCNACTLYRSDVHVCSLIHDDVAN